MTRFAIQGQEDPMSTLSRMAIEIKYEDLPNSIVDHAKRAILDTVAVIMGGSAMEAISSIVDFVKDKRGKPESHLPIYGGRLPASEVAMALGPMARAMDFGDVHEEASHSSEYTIPALLAATGLKNRVTGKEFITAYVIGQETLIRIGKAFKGPSRGFSTGRGHGHFIFGCVAAVGKLLGLSFDQLANAQGIARQMTQPHDLAAWNPATLMVRVHHGFICQDAINVCLLAGRGITGPWRDVLAAPRGYLGFAKWETDPGALTSGLGEEWEMTNTQMKPYTACKGAHTSIDGIIDLMREHGFRAEDIASIHFQESPVNLIIVCEPKEVRWNPQTIPECQFSLPYLVATAAYDGNISLDSFTPEARARKKIRELMNRISVEKESKLPHMAAIVNITLKDGRKFSKECIYSKGHPKNPFSKQELIDKFKMCVRYSAYIPNDSTIDCLINSILDLDRVEDVVNSIILPLTPVRDGVTH